MLDWKRKLALLAVPAVLAVGAVSVAAHAASPPTLPAPADSQPAVPVGLAETPGTSTAEANESGLPGGGHSDMAGQAEHQFEGSE